LTNKTFKVKNGLESDGAITGNSTITITDGIGTFSYSNTANFRVANSAASNTQVTPGGIIFPDATSQTTAGAAPQSNSAILTQVKDVDGASSGLDSDLLDGQHGSYYSTLGQHTIWVPAGAMIPRVTTAAATLNTIEMTTNLLPIQTMDFPTATDAFAAFFIQMPKGWDEGTLIAQFIWSTLGTQTGGLDGVAWFISAGAFANSDVLSTALGTAIGVTQDHSATVNDLMITAESAAITVAGTPGAEEWVAFEVYRDVSDAADDLDIDARLHGVKIHYTIDAATDS